MDKLISETAKKHGVDLELISKLLEYEQQRVHLERRRGARLDIRRVIEEAIGSTNQ